MTQPPHHQKETVGDSDANVQAISPSPIEPQTSPILTHHPRNVELQASPFWKSYPIQCLRERVQQHVDEDLHDHVQDLGT